MDGLVYRIGERFAGIFARQLVGFFSIFLSAFAGPVVFFRGRGFHRLFRALHQSLEQHEDM